MSFEHHDGPGQSRRGRLDPKKLLAEAIAGGQADYAAGSWQPPAVERLDEIFDELDVVELIGRGGMGAVYRAVQRKLARTVALKVLPPELAKDAAFEERFLREARALAGLKHARILTVHDFGEREGFYYLVTEFVEGMNLRQLMEMGELSPAEALRITPQICEALQYAHDHGVVHRDIKPENLLIDTDGDVRIADFGLARILNDDQQPALTRSTQSLGTPQYMAPEQWRDGRSVDHRADIYAVGVVLYEMLTGQLPIGHFDPPSRRQGVPKELDAIVQRSLAQRPEERFQQASDVSSELQRHHKAAEAVASDKDAAAVEAGSDEVVWGRVPGVLKAAWIVAVLTVVVTMGLFTHFINLANENDEAARAHAKQWHAAHEWASARSDVAGDDQVVPRYIEEVLVPEWQARKVKAQTDGVAFKEPRPQLFEDAPATGSGSIAWKLMAGVGVMALFFPICGFVSIATLRRRRHRAGLGIAIFTAWVIPSAIVIAAAVGLLNENIRDHDTAMTVSAIVGVTLSIGAALWMIWQYRLHTRVR